MAIRFRLKGLAETLIEEIECPCCGTSGVDDTHFSTEHTKVTFQGIVVVLQCLGCGEIFVPGNQKSGILNQKMLKEAVESDHDNSGEPLYKDCHSVVINAEKLNAYRKGAIH